MRGGRCLDGCHAMRRANSRLPQCDTRLLPQPDMQAGAGNNQSVLQRTRSAMRPPQIPLAELTGSADRLGAVGAGSGCSAVGANAGK